MTLDISGNSGGVGSSLTNAHIFVGNVGNSAADVVVSGDVSLANTGAFTVSKIGGKAVTLANSLTTSGNFALTLTATGITNVTLPTSGTLAALGGTNTWTAVQTINLNAASAPAGATGTGLQLVGVDATVARFEVDAFGAIGAFTIRRANGTGASPTALASADQIGAFNFHGYYVTGGPAYSGVQASVQGFASQNWTSTTLGTKIVLSTTPNGSTTLTTAATFDQDQSLILVGALSGTRGTFSPAANSTALTISAASHTGSDASSDFSLSSTINTSGSPDLVKWSFTDTARGASTKLFNIYAGASGTTSRFSVDRIGTITAGDGINLSNSQLLFDIGRTVNNPFVQGYRVSSTDLLLLGATNIAGMAITLDTIGMLSGSRLGWNSGANFAAWTPDTFIYRDATGILAQRNAANAQTLRVYNTFTDASNYERGIFDWQGSSNVLSIGTEKAGTGSTRNVRVLIGGTVKLDYGIATASRWTLVDGLNLPAAAILSMASGTNQRAGNAVLVGGTVTVSNTTVTANTVVLLTRKTSGGTIGTAITYTLSAGASFTVNSDNILDTSTFSYVLVEVP